MKSFILTLSILILTASINLYAQHLAAYTDYMGRFYVFDNGKSIQIEDLEPQSYLIGGESILYKNSSGHLMGYFDGKVQMLERTGASQYYATDHLAAYNIYQKLSAIYKGKKQVLSAYCTAYDVQDSLIAFYDKYAESLRVFYEGRIQDIESGMIGTPIKTWSSGDNIVAYISENTSDFKIWYRGKLFVVERNVENTKFKSGRDIVAFIDENEQNFKVFYKGEIYKIEDFLPQHFQVGDGFVAYVDDADNFKIFEKGEVFVVSSYKPQEYFVEDNLLTFYQDNYFKVWYDGDVVDIEAFIPSLVKMDWNTIAYLDKSNRIWIFQDGERKYLSNEFVNSFEIYRDLIKMNVKVNRNIIYYKKKYYEGNSFYK